MIAFEIPDELLARCAGQALICKKVIERFVQQMQSDVPQLRQLLNDGDPEKASKLAHRIKGASANVAADNLRAIGGRLELAAAEGRCQDALLLADELEAAWPKYEALTAVFLQS